MSLPPYPVPPDSPASPRSSPARTVLRRGRVVALLVALLGGTAQAQDTLQVLPGDTAPLTLEECVSAALAHNGSLRAEQIRTGEVRAQITQTLSEGFPTVDVSGSWNRSRDPSFALDETFGGGGGAGSDTGGLDTLFTGLIPAPADIAAQTFWRASVNASWEIRPGRIYNALKAVGSGIAQQEDVVTETEHRVAEETLRAFSNVLLAGERERALLQEAEARRELLAVARRRFRVELGTPLDTLQAAVSLANLSPEIRRAHQDLEDAGAELNVQMGRDPRAPLALQGTPQMEDGDLDPSRFATRVDERPDLRQREHQIHVLRRTRGAQKALHRPYLSMDGSYGYVGRTLDTVTARGHDFWSARVSLVVPLFDGMLTRGQVKETEAEILRSREELTQARRQALQEALSLHGAWKAARDNFRAAELNDALAEEALSETRRRYEVGKADYLAVLNAQSERFRARSNLIEARHEVVSQLASLKRALGFDPRVPLTEVAGMLGE